MDSNQDVFILKRLVQAKLLTVRRVKHLHLRLDY